jgi:hypothetical protein
MERNVKIPYQGLTVDGEELDFKTVSEEWNEYQTSDGSTIRLKLVLTNIVKLLDKTDQDGNPIYVAKSSNVMAVSVPGKMKKGTVH